MDTIVSVCWYPMHDQHLLRRLGRQIKDSLNADHQHHAEMDEEDIETLFASYPYLVKESCHRTKG